MTSSPPTTLEAWTEDDLRAELAELQAKLAAAPALGLGPLNAEKQRAYALGRELYRRRHPLLGADLAPGDAAEIAKRGPSTTN